MQLYLSLDLSIYNTDLYALKTKIISMVSPGASTNFTQVSYISIQLSSY